MNLHRGWIRLALGAVLAWVCFAAASVKACAVCGCGDPTLTSMGNEKLFAGRLRVALGVTSRTDVMGTPKVNQFELFEVRNELSVVYAPLSRLALSAVAPFLWRSVSDSTLQSTRFVQMGDAEARAKFTLFQDKEFSPSHIIATHAGLKFPTAPVLRGANGQALAVELQPGTGSFDGLLGASYSFFAHPVSAYLSATGFWPTRGLHEFRAGKSLRVSAFGQYQITPWLGLRGGVDTRWDAVATSGVEPEPDSGGFIAFASPELLWSPKMDWVVRVGARLPVLNALYGNHREGPMFYLGAIYDL